MPRDRKRPSAPARFSPAPRDQASRSRDYVLVDGVVVPRDDVVRGHLEEAASYEGPAQTEVVRRGADQRPTALRDSEPPRTQGPTAYQREVARLNPKLRDSTPPA